MLCLSAVGRKNKNSTHDESQDWQWSEAGGIHPDYTSTSLETHGEHNEERLDEKARKAGL